MKKAKAPGEKRATELIEEATHLIRSMPLGITALYYIGSLPFILGLLYFVADMSKSAFAYMHQAEATLSMVLLFVWMKCWQTVFCCRVRSHISGLPAAKWPMPGIIRLCLAQTAIQPLGLIILPIAAVITLPFGYAYAFFQNATVIGDGIRDKGSLKSLYRAALRQAGLQPRQNHVILLIMLLFWFLVFLNVIIVMFVAPRLLKTFLGMDTAFTLSGWSLLNTTFFAAAFALTHLVVDPLMKTIYVLRCFYGESLHTGEDLRIGLRLARGAAYVTVVLSALILFSGHGAALASSQPQAAVTSAGPQPADLDRALSEEIGKRDYAWRLPRPKIDKTKDRGVFAEFIDGVIDTVSGWLKSVRTWISEILRWIADHLLKPLSIAPGGQDRGWPGSTQLLLYVLGAVAACMIAVFSFRHFKKRNRTIEAAGEALPEARDLASDEVTADELPSDEWLALARSMLDKGDLRLALRALYLASLAHLAGRGMITIARYKSNHDYERELMRRSSGYQELISAFSHNISIFEGVWYGMHELTRETFTEFSDTHERIISLADRY